MCYRIERCGSWISDAHASNPSMDCVCCMCQDYRRHIVVVLDIGFVSNQPDIWLENSHS